MDDPNRGWGPQGGQQVPMGQGSTPSVQQAQGTSVKTLFTMEDGDDNFLVRLPTPLLALIFVIICVIALIIIPSVPWVHVENNWADISFNYNLKEMDSNDDGEGSADMADGDEDYRSYYSGGKALVGLVLGIIIGISLILTSIFRPISIRFTLIGNVLIGLLFLIPGTLTTVAGMRAIGGFTISANSMDFDSDILYSNPGGYVAAIVGIILLFIAFAIIKRNLYLLQPDLQKATPDNVFGGGVI